MLFSNEGYCTVCMADTTFEARGEWLRDRYVCRRCGSIPRQRALVHLLNQLRPGWPNATIHESPPSLDFFAQRCPRYSYSFFLEGVAPGSAAGDKHCENLEQLTFPDGSFDSPSPRTSWSMCFVPTWRWRRSCGSCATADCTCSRPRSTSTYWPAASGRRSREGR